MINEVDEKYKAEDKNSSSMGREKRVNKDFVALLAVIAFIAMIFGGYFVYKKMLASQATNVSNKKNVSVNKPSTEVNIQKDKNVKIDNSKVPSANDNNIANNSIENEKKNLIALNEAVKPLKIEVDLDKQRVYVYDAKARMVQAFVCSSGIAGADTPKGEYTIKERGYSFFSEKYQEGAYYWTQFMGNYLFHSVPFDKNQNIEASEEQKLGTKASHGCVRLAISDAKWIHDNIPRGTLVVIK